MINTTLKLPPTGFDEKYAKLIRAYNGLTSLNQTIVHILAVIYYETARTHIVNSLKKLTVQNIDVKKFTVKNLDPILTELVDLGLVESSNTSFRCCPLLLEPLCRMLVEQDRFHETAAAVQQAMPVKA